MFDAAGKERIDAWGADLADDVRWEIYDSSKGLAWPKGVADRLEAMGISHLPSRAGWYRFLARMRKADAARRIEKIAQSVAEAQAVAELALAAEEPSGTFVPTGVMS